MSYSPNQEVFEAGSFIGRVDEQDKFRRVLQELTESRKGIFSAVFGSSSQKNRQELNATILSRIILINGESGIGKTRLALQLRRILNKDREYKGRFQASRLDWLEALERDQRVGADFDVPAEVALDIFHTHFIRDDLESQLEEYRQAVEDTRQLAARVTGAELVAVWEYRGKALGRGMHQTARSKPLVFFLDNFRGSEALAPVLLSIMEESGPQVVWVICGQNLPVDLAGKADPANFFNFTLSPFSEDELRRFIQAELKRYEDGQSVPESSYSPDSIAHLRTITGGSPLAARLATFLLLGGFEAQAIQLPPGTTNPALGLLDLFLDEAIGPGHPDRLKLYGLAILRRPEKGLLANMLDLKADMLSSDEITHQLETHYAFLFEPARPMVFHQVFEIPLQKRLFQPEFRLEEHGLLRLNQRAVDFLAERLIDWGRNFLNLSGRIRDVTWTNWALDLVWHSFWLNENSGWQVALPLFIAGMEYKPTVAANLLTVLERIETIDAFENSDEAQARVKLLRKLVNQPANREVWQDLFSIGEAENWFDQRWPQFASEFELIVEEKIKP